METNNQKIISYYSLILRESTISIKDKDGKNINKSFNDGYIIWKINFNSEDIPELFRTQSNSKLLESLWGFILGLGIGAVASLLLWVLINGPKESVRFEESPFLLLFFYLVVGIPFLIAVVATLIFVLLNASRLLKYLLIRLVSNRNKKISEIYRFIPGVIIDMIGKPGVNQFKNYKLPEKSHEVAFDNIDHSIPIKVKYIVKKCSENMDELIIKIPEELKRIPENELNSDYFTNSEYVINVPLANS